MHISEENSKNLPILLFYTLLQSYTFIGMEPKKSPEEHTNARRIPTRNKIPF